MLFTDIDHDMITNLASLFGLIATIGIMVGLYQTKARMLFAFGVLNMILVCLNNYLYYNQDLIVYLPLVQKVTFVSFLGWICGVSINARSGYLYNK
ncbi:MAG: hypothetical protein WDO14_19015 [Bacteroidota bacterium]